jgi:hypothetical protein
MSNADKYLSAVTDYWATNKSISDQCGFSTSTSAIVARGLQGKGLIEIRKVLNIKGKMLEVRLRQVPLLSKKWC